MTSINGHFDGKAVVLDEPPPLTLAVGQQVRVIVDAPALSGEPGRGAANAEAASAPSTTPRKPLAGFAKGMFGQTSTPCADPTAALMYGESFDERDALRIDPLDAVPPDFVRQPGSGAGEIELAEDFDETPDDFEAYL